MAENSNDRCTSTSAPTSSLEKSLLQDLLSPVYETVEQELKWYKSESPTNVVKGLTSDAIPSLISCLQSTKVGSLKCTDYGYPNLLQMQTIGLTRLSFLLLKMNDASTSSSIISCLVRRFTSNSNEEKEEELRDQPQHSSITVKSLLFVLLHALQPVAGLTSASATIWKSICDLSQAYPQPAIEIRVVQESMHCLVKDIIQSGIASCCSTAVNSHNGESKKMVKLLNFFLSRLDSLLRICSSNQKDVVRYSPKTDAEIYDIMKHLISWRGDIGLSPSMDIQSLEKKLDVCLETLVSFNRRDGSESIESVHLRMLEDFSLMNLTRETSSMAYGTWIFLLHLMEQLYISFLKTQWMEISTWEIMLSTVESLLLRILPKCHHVIIMDEEHMTLSRSLKVISKLLMFLERFPVLMDVNKGTKTCNFITFQHRLISWLGFCDHEKKSMHAMSYELVLSTVYLHAIISNYYSSDGKGYIICHMIQLCSNLVFSDRTSDVLRNNICCLMSRIMSNESSQLKSVCGPLLLLEFQNFMSDIKPLKVSKRKRSGDCIYHRWKTLSSYHNLQILIAKLLGRTFWSRLGEVKRETLIKNFEDLLLLHNEDDKRLERVKLLVLQAPHLLSIAVLSLVSIPQEFKTKKDIALKCILDGLVHANENSCNHLLLFRCYCLCLEQMKGYKHADPIHIQRVLQQLCHRSSTYQKFGIGLVLPCLGVFVNNNAPSSFSTVRSTFTQIYLLHKPNSNHNPFSLDHSRVFQPSF